ncbi:MAG: hypothetical protein R2882_05910 [Gemmatimonadales bacterium]
MTARDAVTGASHRFAGRGSRIAIDRADAPALLATSFFRRID